MTSPLKLWLIIILISIVGCQAPVSTPESQSPAEKRLDTQLVLNKAILEQSNKHENTVWKIKADNIVYSEDHKTATLDQVVGNLLQDDKIIFQISAKSGEVKNNGNIIVLKKDIVARDPRNDSVIKSEVVEWRPQKNLLLIKDNLTGIHPNLSVSANSGQYLTNTESLEIQGNVIATADKPPLQLKGDLLIWDIAQNKVSSPGTVNIVRYDQGEKITDRLVSDRAEIDLASNIATLNQNIELISLQPNLQAATEYLTWNYQQRIGQTNQPIQILDRDRQISLTGNQGEINLQQQTAKLQGGIQGINQQNPSELYARQLTWKIDTGKIEATGNVIYEQDDPQARLTGEKATGSLGNNNIVVTSNGKKQVTSVIRN